MIVDLISYTKDPEYVITLAAATCYSDQMYDGLEKKCSDPEYQKKMLKMLLENGHESPLEHANFTFFIGGITRTTSHQLVRHRIASYSQRSQRYTTMRPEEFSIPESIKQNPHAQALFEQHLKDTFDLYNAYIEDGIPKEDAREILPNATQTSMVMTMNLRELRHFMELRMCCYDDQTEVLTQNGWKLFKDLKDEDFLYTLNPETFNVDYFVPKHIISEDYSGNMVNIIGHNVCLSVTPNHEVFVSNSYDNKNFRLVEAKDASNYKMCLMKKNSSKIEGIITDKFVLPGFTYSRKNQFKSWDVVIPPKEVDIKDLFMFLGFYISDGCISKAGRHYNIYLSKGNRDVLDQYSNILSRLSKNKPRIVQDGRAYKLILNDRQLYTFLESLSIRGAKNKAIPGFVFKYDHSILRYLYYGLLQGDSNKTNEVSLDNLFELKGITYTTVSKKLADNIQQLMLHLGLSASISESMSKVHIIENDRLIKESKHFNVSINVSSNEPILKSSLRNGFSTSQYNGKVYCVNVEKNHVIYVRKDGKSVWSGNCRAQSGIQELADRIYIIFQNQFPLLITGCGPKCWFGKCTEKHKTKNCPKNKL